MIEKIWPVFYSPYTGLEHKKDFEIRDLPLDEKLENIKQNIADSYNFILNNNIKDIEKEIVIFSAPEWYFRPPNGSKSNYNQYEMKVTFLDLKDFSKNFKSLLIIPGTFYYLDKPFAYNCTAIIANGDILSVIHKMMEADIEFEKKGIEKWGMYDGLTDDEIKDKRPDGYKKRLEIATKNYSDLNIEINQFFKLSKENENSGLFEYENLSLGLEICRDHSGGRLQAAIENRKKKSVDIQILISADVAIKKNECILQKGGYFYWNDGKKAGGVIAICEGIKTEEGERDEAILNSQITTSTRKCYGRSGSIFQQKMRINYSSDDDVVIYDPALKVKKKKKLSEIFEIFN